MGYQVLSTAEFYTRLAEYMNKIDPAWAEELWTQNSAKEWVLLAKALGEGNGRPVLDCSCGTGLQAIPLAQLGWRVTAIDLTPSSLQSAFGHAKQAGVSIDFKVSDMRNLAQQFPARFDCAISCMALDNITDDGGIQQAVNNIYEVIKPGGTCYIRLRNFDQIMEDRPRYEFKQERRRPHGRVLWIEDWDYLSETQIIHIYAFLHEDKRRDGYPWDYEALGYVRRVVHKADIEHYLSRAGFRQILFLPSPNRWSPMEILAHKP